MGQSGTTGAQPSRRPQRQPAALGLELRTYDLKDLTAGNNGLLQNEVALDSTYGFLARPRYAICCGYTGLTFDPNEIGLPIGGNDPASIMGEDECNSQEDDISPSFSAWASDNTSIAQLTYKNVKELAVGSTTGTAEGDVLIGAGGFCAYDPENVTVPVTVEAVPSSEITEYQGTYQISAGQFLMTLGPSTNNYDGHSVTETSPVIGTNTCWWSGSNMVQYPTVQGSTWTVDQGDAGHNQYGLDTVGYSSGVVNLIQTQGEAHGVDFPCTVTIYQEMNYDGIDVYTDNLLTQTIGSNTVKVCRAGVCSGTIPY